MNQDKRHEKSIWQRQEKICVAESIHLPNDHVLFATIFEVTKKEELGG